MLGSDLADLCRKTDIETLVLDLPEFDINETSQLEAAVKASPLLVNCAAYTDVNRAESEQDLANKVNAQAVANLGSFARKAGTWVLHISTDFVFDGKLDRPYTEQDTPNPINAYGRSKLAGEKLLLESQCPAAILRVEWTYGKNGNNFVKKLIRLAENRKEISVVDDQVGSPTATVEVAKAIIDLLKQKPHGLFHFAGSGYVSRFEMARFIFEKLKMDVEAMPCKTADFKSPAPRPLNSRFDCSKISSLLSLPIKPWQEPLEKFLKDTG